MHALVVTSNCDEKIMFSRNSKIFKIKWFSHFLAMILEKKSKSEMERVYMIFTLKESIKLEKRFK